MPVINDDPLTIIYERLYDDPEIDMSVIDRNYEDPFWGSFEHAIKALEYLDILTAKKCKYWFDFVEEKEYPTEKELDEFVNICKEGIKSIIKDPTVASQNTCWFAGLETSVDNIEGYWPYA